MFPKESENPPLKHPPTLDEIQIRAYRAHRHHGGISGGYTLEEWLEAEHELNEERESDQRKEEQAHSRAKRLAVEPAQGRGLLRGQTSGTRYAPQTGGYMMEYKVIKVKDSETLQAKLNQEGNQGWRLVSVAMGPRGYLHAIMEKQASGS